MKRMQITDHKTKLVVTHKDDGKFLCSITYGSDGTSFSQLCRNFYEAGEFAFEMADNNDQGRKFNHRMCDVFKMTFA
jgi:hypothetical protein